MKATIIFLMAFASLVVISCGQDSPKGSGPIDVPILLPQLQGGQGGEDSGSGTLTVTGDTEPSGGNVAGETEETTEGKTEGQTGQAEQTGQIGQAGGKITGKIGTELYNSVCCETGEKGEDQSATKVTGGDSSTTDPQLFDFTLFAAKAFGGKTISFNFNTDEQVSQPEPAMVMTESAAPWLVAFELTGRIVQYGIVKIGGNNSLDVEQDAELSFDFKDDSHECLKLFKIEIDLVGADYSGEVYSEGLLHISAERCVVSDTETSTTISPDKFKIDMDDYKFWDPCLGEVVANGRITCESINSENKEASFSKFFGTKWCVTSGVTYEVAGSEYEITMPVGDQPFMATWNGKDIKDASIFKLKGGVEIDGKYAGFNFGMHAPAKVLSCLNI